MKKIKDIIVLVLILAHVERFCVSRVGDLFEKGIFLI